MSYFYSKYVYTTADIQKFQKNIDTFLFYWASIPRKNIDLGEWTEDGTNKTDCGTVACAIGWAARMPEFKKMGVKLTRCGVPSATRVREGGDVSEFLFGGYDLWDPEHYANFSGGKGTQHAQVAKRFKALRKEYAQELKDRGDD